MSVAACLRSGTRVDVAWNLDTAITPRFDSADAVAITPGGGRLGALLGGALDSRLIEWAAAHPSRGQLLTLQLGPHEAPLIGVEPGTKLRLAITPADALPPELWERLIAREPVTLTLDLDGTEILASELSDPDEQSSSVDENRITTVWAPRPNLVVVGPGPMARGVAAAGEFVGWQVTASEGPETAIGLVATLSPIDGVVVVGHDIEATGRVLQAALGSRTGYIGSLGPARILEARQDWLAYRGVTEVGRVRAPAGLDIGARDPAEVGIAVVAEMIAARRHTAAA